MVMDYIIEDLMEEVVERKGSDLHISAGLPPYIRVNGHLNSSRIGALILLVRDDELIGSCRICLT